MKKTKGRKSRASVPLRIFSSDDCQSNGYFLQSMDYQCRSNRSVFSHRCPPFAIMVSPPHGSLSNYTNLRACIKNIL
jgi:hypothetical protein